MSEKTIHLWPLGWAVSHGTLCGQSLEAFEFDLAACAAWRPVRVTCQECRVVLDCVLERLDVFGEYGTPLEGAVVFEPKQLPDAAVRLREELVKRRTTHTAGEKKP